MKPTYVRTSYMYVRTRRDYAPVTGPPIFQAHEMEAVVSSHYSSEEEDEEGPVAITATSSVSQALQAGTTLVMTSPKVSWDPMTSPDWDKEKPSADAIVRIKG